MAKDKPQPTDQDPARDKDAEILVGGPGQDDPVEEKKESATPTGVEMTIAGQKYTLHPAIASALYAREMQRKQFGSELTQKYEREKRQQEFWRDFKSRHKDLEGDDLVIHAVAAKNAASLNTITDPIEMADKIADFARREILRIATRAKSDTPDKTRAVVEGKSIESPKPTPRPDTEEKGSLSQTIRDRRKARHEAALSKGGK